MRGPFPGGLRAHLAENTDAHTHRRPRPSPAGPTRSGGGAERLLRLGYGRGRKTPRGRCIALVEVHALGVRWRGPSGPARAAGPAARRTCRASWQPPTSPPVTVREASRGRSQSNSGAPRGSVSCRAYSRRTHFRVSTGECVTGISILAVPDRRSSTSSDGAPSAGVVPDPGPAGSARRLAASPTPRRSASARAVGPAQPAHGRSIVLKVNDKRRWRSR